MEPNCIPRDWFHKPTYTGDVAWSSLGFLVYFGTAHGRSRLEVGTTKHIEAYRIDGRCTMGAAIVPQLRVLGGQATPLHQS